MNKIFAIKLKSDISGGGEIRIIADKEKISSSYLDYLHDESRLSYGEIECIAFPETEAQVAEFLQFANLRRMPVTISNGRTGIVGGAVPLKGALLSLEKLNKILEVKCIDSNYTVAMQAGVSLNELAKFLDGKNFPDGKYFYPVDVTEMTARIGGTVATNASGERSFRYGPTRNWVKRIRVVLATGEVLEINRGEIFADERNEFEIEFPDGRITKIKIPSYKMPSVKSVAGYYTKPKMDLIDLFIGSEGTLGVITEIEIKIIKKPENILSLFTFFPTEKDALNFFVTAKNELKDAIVFEYFDSYAFEILREKFQQLPKHANAGIFFELIFSEENLDNIFNIIDKMLRENNASPDEALGSYERQDIERIRDIRHALPATINETIANRKTKYPNIHKISVDIAVPEDKLLEMINYYKAVLDPLNFEYTIFGHIGEAHLHMNILPRNNEEFVRAKDLHLDFAHKAVELQGTVSGEHGIGKIKHNYLEVMYGREAIKQMIAVKKALDPNCILNRGNIFPEKLLYE